jgi:branched-subunit amino acid transport protein
VFSVFLNILDKGITIILPFAFLDTEQNLSQLFESHLAELPAAIMTALLIDSKRFGRKRGL